ncbi:type II toxin-antitoxin system RelE/ParE family toxin [Streptomyces olivochromogenes]|uniref:type II toxin-antitoxin system RelE/ParE family toxin n=1 Tax=Streptomyces olivochromogenes TaxID=1963 RepID=UPI001F2CCB15|nr:type II toxin-antitoxin system RelE/ParE family toxin [Streptomyces olivochromogenes]MCF3137298.1 type II toxin-antitoxin system RelE/ParE family toxin [Streptomyces olivochromogenes]
MTQRWEFYQTSVGADVVRKEMFKCQLTRDEKAKLGRLMERAQRGELLAKDRKDLRGGLLELRLDCGERIFRLFYGEVEAANVLLAVKFVNKKSTQGIATDPTDIETARKRLNEWQIRSKRDDQRPDALN